MVAIVAVLVIRRRESAQPARAVTIDRGDVVREVFGRGTIESRREAQLGFDMVGRISDVLVDEGDRVKLGQVLAHLDPEQLRADVRTASSSVSLAKSAIHRLEAEGRRAEANLTFTTAEEARVRTLASSGAVSARDLDLATQQLALARAERDRVTAALAEAGRQIQVASGAAAERSVTAGRAALVSPFDGLVVRRLRDPGDTATVGATVLRVVATDALWSRANIDESELSSLAEGQPVRVRYAATGEPSAVGTVDRVGREVDRQTHELIVDVALRAPPPRVAIGQRADVWIEVERHKDAVRLPSAFLRRDTAGTFAWVDRAGRVARVPVAVGLRGTDRVEILSGLAPGDVVLDAADPSSGAVLGEGRRWARVTP